MEKLVRECICELIGENSGIINIAVKQRAKFEGWLKFELANKMIKKGFNNVIVEANYTSNSGRADIGFLDNDEQYYIELKTTNTNFKIKGIENKTRPITKNIESIIVDTKKIKKDCSNGIIAFILFPIPIMNSEWKNYLMKISNEIGVEISEERNCSKKEVILENNDKCYIVICSYMA